MSLIESFLLGLLQGITEFLPISSSGHIVIAQALFGELPYGITFELVLHFGTLGSIVVYFYNDIVDMIKSAWSMILSPVQSYQNWDDDYSTRLNVYILVSMIPAGIAGFTIRHQIEEVFANPVGISLMFLVTGTFLFFTKFFGYGKKTLNMKNIFLIGLAQAFSLLPGISRSGATISMAVFLKINREDIARFTFLMMLPVIFGAMLVEVLETSRVGISEDLALQYAIGFITALVSGYYALKYLIELFKSKGIHYFAYYCWLIGGLGIIYFGFILGEASPQ
ncbi:MAG: undecaprenyl-diphosphate phosphatase [Balneolales bacterium]